MFARTKNPAKFQTADDNPRVLYPFFRQVLQTTGNEHRKFTHALRVKSGNTLQ